MKTVSTVARFEMLSATRERLPRMLLVVFLGMIAASSVIGWLSHTTVSAIYDQVLRDGLTTAANPFLGSSPLRNMTNSVIYVIVIGALLASITGVQSTLRDRKMATTDLILVRPNQTAAYLGGKLLGQALWLLAIVAVATGVNILSISIISGSFLSPLDSARIISFYLASWLFLMGFLAVGMISGLRSRSEATALLLPILLWGLLVFVLPQLGTAAHPVSLLNPVAVIASQGSFFQLVNVLVGPLALGEQFKVLSTSILGLGSPVTAALNSLTLLIIFTTVTISALLATPRSALRSSLDE